MVDTSTALGRRDAINATFAFALVGLGVFGFRTSFGGLRFLAVGLAGAALGIAVAAVAVQRRLPALVTAAGSIVVLLALGGFAVPDAAFAGVFPSPESVAALIDGAARGWARLLTSQTPAGTADHVLTVPLVCGYLGGLGAFLLARRAQRTYAFCVVPPLAVLALSVLLGIDRPANLLLQGGVFAAVGIAWISQRFATRVEVIAGSARPGRFAAAGAMLSVALVLATVIGPNVPGAARASSDRYVLRDRVVPPFDPNDYPSPLAGYRRYVDETYKKTPMLTVTSDKPLPQGTPIRLAAMDYFNGVVWSMGPQDGGPTTGAAGTFQRVGTQILGAQKGDNYRLKVTIGDLNAIYPQVWVPLVGSPRSVRFAGERAEELQTAFRFNRAGEDGANTATLRKGDTYEVTTNLPPTKPDGRDKLQDPGLPPFQDNFLSEELAKQDGGFLNLALQQLNSDGSDAQKVRRLQDYFAGGFYYDESDPRGFRVPPGHSLAHLVQFTGTNLIGGSKPVGDAEQYAAGMGMVARMSGAPARVVLGFRNDKRRFQRVTTFTAGEMEAWVELHFASLGWVAFYPTPPRDRINTEQPTPRSINTETSPDSETPVTAPPPNISSIERTKAQKGKPEDKAGGSNPLLRIAKLLAIAVGVPATATAVPIIGLLIFKGRRRARRRTRGSPATRVAGGWAEGVDFIRDLGHAVPARLTRQETAQLIGLGPVATLADRADEFAFGALAPTDDDAARYWTAIDEFARNELDGMTFWQRLKVRANPTSLRLLQADRLRLNLPNRLTPKIGDAG